MTVATYAAYEVGLGDIPLPQLQELIVVCARKYRALPSVAEILAEYEGAGEQKFLPAPLKTAAQLDEERAGRMAIPNVAETMEKLRGQPDPFPPGYVFPRESKEARLARLRATQDWERKYH